MPQSSNKTIGFFVTCLVDLFRPSVGFAAIKLLQQAGYQVKVPEVQTCCGQPAYNSGDRRTTKAIAKQVIAAFDGFDYVVAPSGSCLAMIKLHYPKLLHDDPRWRQRAEMLAARCYELTTFLDEVGEIDINGVHFNHTVTYHDSCSGLRELEVKSQPRRLLEKITGLSVNEMQDSEVCCGFGGTFCVKYPAISERMVNDKVNHIEQSRADVVLGGDLGCLLNIAGRLQRCGKAVRVYHIAEVLADMADQAIGEANSKSDQS